MRNAWFLLVLALLASGRPQILLAQSPAAADSSSAAAADSTRSGNLLSRVGESAELGSSVPDSVLAQMQQEAPSFAWISNVSNTLTGKVGATVSDVSLEGKLSNGAQLFGGGTSASSFTIADRRYRQQERDAYRRDFTTAYDRPLGDLLKMNLNFSNKYDEDITVFGVDNVTARESEDYRGALAFRGGGELTKGFGHAFSLSGDVFDHDGVNRETTEKRTDASGGVTSLWTFDRGDLSVEGRFGYKRASGNNELRGLEANSNSRQDTLATKVEYEGHRFNFSTDVQRAVYIEDRLDFRRNTNGVIDTVGAERPVSNEQERRRGDRINGALSYRVLPVLNVRGVGSYDLTETRWTLNEQGLLRRGNDEIDLGLDFRYAEAGSLTVSYTVGNRWDDRRFQGNTSFRGRETRRTEEAKFEMSQRLFSQSDLTLSFGQRLQQNLFEEEGNNRDRDELIDRADARIVSRAIPNLQLNASGSISVTRLVNLASESTSNNKEDRLFSVIGGYRWFATDKITLEQNYRMQIIFIDFHTSDSRDRFNKQGQVVSKLGYQLPRNAKLNAEYALDFRSNGTRQADVTPGQISFRTDLRRFTHRVRADINIPISIFDLAVDSEREFLRDKNTAGVTTRSEDSGDIRMKLSGTKKLFTGKLDVSVNVTRVLAYGPRVRAESERYWIANSTITMKF